MHLLQTAVGIAGSPWREGSTAVISLDGDTSTPCHPKPTCVATYREHSGIFFPFFFQNICGGGSPCTTHPWGTPNKPSGLIEGEKKKKEGSALYWVSFPFLKCFLWILGEELRSGEQLYQRRGRPGQGRVTWLLCGCEKPMKRKGWRKIFDLN